MKRTIQKSPNAKGERVRFGAPEYFEFIAKNPQAMPWIALGQNVQILLNNTICEIYDAQ